VKMLSNILFTLFACVVAAVNALEAPTPPGLTWLYTCNATLADAIEVGAGPHGTRKVIPITGGWFKGPRMSGMATQAKDTVV